MTATPPDTGIPAMTMRVEDQAFIAMRVFDAPRALVFKTWAECEHLAEWWGPAGWTLPVCKMDFRPGGVWHYCMRSPNGEPACGRATYHEIVEPERIVYTDEFADEAGNVLTDMPSMFTTVLFTETNGRTTITNRFEFASVKDLDTVIGMGMEEGLTESWDRLEAHLAARSANG